MNATGDRMADTARQIEDVLTEADRYWRRIGIPRSERETRLEELRGHLVDATAQGRHPWEVVRPDPTAFAARWIGAGRLIPWSSIALRFVGVVAVSLGAIALLGPWAFGYDRFGLMNEGFVLIGVIALATLAVDIAQRYRAHLTRQTVVLLAIAGVVAAGVVGGTFTAAFRGAPVLDRGVVELPVLLVLVLLAFGAGSAVLASRLRISALAGSR